MLKKCEVCGAGFECTQGPGCWCTEVNVAGLRRSEIAKQARDCVCPDCLSKQ